MAHEFNITLRQWGVVNFTYEEMTLLRSDGTRADPEPYILPNILPTAIIAQTIRSILKAPVITISGYRPADYNRGVGGAPHSEHVSFRALDLSFPDLERLWEVTTKVVEAFRSDPGWNVGLIYYDWGVHIDTDAAGWKGRNRTIDNRTK